MHAVVTSLTFKDRAAAEAELSEIVARVSGMPGFVDGYWIALGADRGTSIIVFESQKAAQALANFAQGAPYGSVAPEAIRVGEVLAHGSPKSAPTHRANAGERKGTDR